MFGDDQMMMRIMCSRKKWAQQQQQQQQGVRRLCAAVVVAVVATGASALSAAPTTAYRAKPKLAQFRDGGGRTKAEALAVARTLPSVQAAATTIGPRDVVVRCYDISSDGKLAPALSLATSKRVHWFPKLTCGVGDRAWAYDGEIERTSNAVVANAAGGAATVEFNLGPCAYDDAGIDGVLQEMERDYNEEEYDFFFRNCNHFANDLAERLTRGTAVEAAFVDEFVVRESESLLCNMRDFQKSLTVAVTRQVQKIVIVSWRRSWRKALAEEDERKKSGADANLGGEEVDELQPSPKI